MAWWKGCASSPLEVMSGLKDLLTTYLLGMTEPLTDYNSSGAQNFDGCFRTLPDELIVMIASYLLTREALMMRLMSRSFGFIFHCQQF